MAPRARHDWPRTSGCTASRCAPRFGWSLGTGVLRVAPWVALAAAWAGGCASAPAPRVGGAQAEVASAAAQPAASGLRAEDLGTQSLFRVQYQGREGSGALRLVLKIETPERYLIETKDRFGRSLWRIEGGPGEHLLVDDRLNLYCASGEGIRIPEIALEVLPLGDLPAILFDRLPGGLEPLARPDGSDSVEGEYRDRHWRRWTVTGPRDEPTAWTYWEAGEPRMWWQRQAPGEAVLSHRAGTQLRWKRVASEPMTGALEPLAVEPGYERIACEAWPGASAGEDGP